MSDPGKRVSRRSLIKTTGAGLGGALLAGCTGGGGGGGGGGNGGVDKLTIGLLSPESGAYGFLGKAYTRATELRIEEVKQSSEVLADTEINVVKGDTQSDPDTALEVARELTLQKGADILNGTANSQSAGTVSQFAGQEGIPFLAGMTATQEITHGKNCQWTVARLTPSTYAGPNILGTFGPEELGKSGYVLYPDYTTGYQHRDLVPKAIKAAGGEVLKVTAAPLGNQDYAGIIDEIKSLGPDFIFCGMMGSGALPFYKQCASRGVTAPIMGNLIISQMSYGLSLDELDKLGNLYRFARYTREIPTDANEQFVQTYKEKFDAVPTFPDGFAYQTANLMFNAIEQSGSKEPDAVMTEIEGMRWNDLNGENFIRECDHQGAPKVYVARVTGHDDEFEMGTQEIVKQYDMQDFYPACSDVPCDMASKRPS